jgi:hypothetical protein
VDGDADLDIVGQPVRDRSEDWSNQVFAVRNEDGALSGPELLFQFPEQITDMAAGQDAGGNPWLALSTFTFEAEPWSPEYRN